MPTLRIVNYAVNGAGVGHLARLVAVSRWLRRYAAWLGVKAEIWFLTSSEADTLLFGERFASFKMPSKTAVQESGIDKLAWLSLAKQWVWHSLGLLRPDILIVDTFPRGSFGELLGALDMARHRAFIYRPVKQDVAEAPDFQAMLPLYDTILVPERASDCSVLVPPEAGHRLVHVGAVTRRERVELYPRAEARRMLGIPTEAFAIYVSAGGGGDANAERQLHWLCDTLLENPTVYLVVGAGPLYRGRPRYGPRIAWAAHGDTVDTLQACDAAVSSSGYGTFNELMQARVPTVFLPQAKIADEQEVRAQRAVSAGAAVLLTDESPEQLRNALDSIRRAEVPDVTGRNGARRLAAEVLKLAIPARHVEAAEEAMTDEVLMAGRNLDVEVEAMGQLMRVIDPHEARPEAISRRTIGLVQRCVQADIPMETCLRLSTLVAQRLERVPPLERADAIERILLALVPFDRWGAAATFLKVVAVDREATAAAVADAITGFLSRLHQEGADLMAGVARLSETSGPLRA